MECLVCGKEYVGSECPRCKFPDVQILGDREKAIENLRPAIEAFKAQFLQSVKLEIAAFYWKDADGTVVLAGDDDVEPVTQWKNVVALAGDFYHVVGLKANGTVVSVGPNILGECEVDGWKNIWIPENASRP